jgi:hypothetical protein
MSDIDWSKAPEGATHYHKLNGFFYCLIADVLMVFREGGWHVSQLMTAAQQTLIRRPSPAWNGDGLPPVGVVCEYSTRKSLAVGAEWSEWGACEILVITKHYRIVRIIGKAYTSDHECSFEDSRIKFRPIRTPEQIAANEREAAIDEMTVLLDSDRGRAMRLIAEHLHDAGYRKQADK